MRLCTFLDAGTPRVGRVEGDHVIPLAAPDLVTLIRGGDAGEAGPPVPLNRVSLTAPLRPVKLLGVVRNYALHAAEMREEAPPDPQLFSKLVTAVTGPDGPVVHPDVTGQLDYEGELAVVIGQRAKAVSREAAASHIFGYTCANDVTAMELIGRDPSFPQWARAKGMEGFGAFGPVIETDFDPASAALRTLVGGREGQNYPLADMFFSPAELVHRLSQDMVLEPGDVILCGTSLGVLPMKPGTTVEVVIEGIGSLANVYGG